MERINHTTHLSIAEMPKEEQTRMVNMAERYKEYLAEHAYIPLQDLPKYESAFNQIYHRKPQNLSI